VPVTDVFDGLFIFEMANNHQGSVSHGLKIIETMAKLARQHGIRAGIKFQYRHLDSFIHPYLKDRKDLPHIPRFLETRLTETDFLTLVSAVRDEGLITICTPFDEHSVGLAQDHGIEILKVASCSANDWPLLECIAAANKPVICSTGARSLPDIDKLVSFMTHRNVAFALMHCVSIYPTPPEDVQLNFMTRMMSRFPYVPVGYSGHESSDNFDVVQIAVAKGAAILERHVGIPTDTISLNPYSMTPCQTDQWIRSVLAAQRIGGPSNGAQKRIRQAEIDSMQSLARGVFVKRALKKGERILREDVFFAMPCAPGQTTSGEYQNTMTASRDYEEMEAICERRSPDLINQTRAIIHDAKGLLYEAHIDLGPEFTIELSHHYGMEHFRQTGALMVTVVNREYCKRLVVMLPGQKHPSHLHKQKEETFHILWGDIHLNLEGKTLNLKPGDQVLIPRAAVHSFGSRNGGIFEELSTRHVIGDSYYEDERIKKLDPIQRKTMLDSW
jgi:N-acetylneuraminate synthase